MKKLVILSIFTGIVSFSGLLFAEAQKSGIQLKANLNAPLPGQMVTLTLDVGKNDVNGFVLSDGYHVLAPSKTSPTSWQIRVPENARGEKTFKVIALSSDKVIKSNDVVINVQDIFNGTQKIAMKP